MIGVCIKYFHENYGGMLQAYATTKMLEARGIDYELIQYEKRRTLSEKIMSVPRLLNGVLLNDKYEALKKKMGMKKHPEFAKNDAIRMEAFGRFKKKAFTRFSPVFAGYPALCEGAKRYDAVVTGSDQLWSPAGHLAVSSGFRAYDFLRFQLWCQPDPMVSGKAYCGIFESAGFYQYA